MASKKNPPVNSGRIIRYILVRYHAGKCFVVGRKDVADVQVQMKNVRLKNREAFLHFALTDYREEGIDSCESYNNKD